MTQASKDLCRLCGRVNGILINIFDSSPNNECVAKIEAVIPDVIILRNDSLSKLVCHRCVAKVKEFYEFKENCVHTQTILKNRLPWMSSTVKSTPQRTLSPIIKYIGGPLAHPYGQPEPEVEVLTLSDDEENEKYSTSQNLPPISAHNKSPRSKRPHDVNTTTLSPVRRLPGMHSLRNGNGTTPGAVQMLPVQPALASTTDSPPFFTSAQPNRRSLGPSSSIQRKSAVPRSLTSLTSHPFLSFSQFHQTISAVNQPSRQQSHTALRTSSTVPLAPKRACLQGPGENKYDGRMPWRRSVSGTSTVSSAGSSSLSETSVMAGSPPMPSLVPMTSPKMLPQSNINVHTPGINVSPVGSIMSVGSSAPQTADDCVCDSTVKTRKREKPKPKSKKKPVVLTEADTFRICQVNPNVSTVNIFENTLIFNCNLCNAVLMNEDAVNSHDCSAAKSTQPENVQYSGQSHLNTSYEKLNHEENSNHSICSYVELSSDDEISKSKLAEIT